MLSKLPSLIILDPPDLPVSTPAPVVQNDVGDDDDDEPPLNENDDDDLDDVDQGEEVNTHHLVLAQFDKVYIYISLSLPLSTMQCYGYTF